MDLFSIIFTAVGLAMDCFAVSLGIGTGTMARTVRPIFRLSFHFGLFQGLMTLIGWLVGSTVAQLIENLDHWLVFALLCWVGGRMIVEGLKKAEEIVHKVDPSRGGTLVMLSVATSLDALAVGLSLAIVKVNIFTSSLLIGIITTALSLVGLLVGKSLGKAFGKRMEVIGGVILIFIGLRILITHLL